MLGFGTTLIRYLPTSEVKEKKINTAFTVVTLASLLFGIIYLIGLPWWTPKLMFVRSSIPLLLLTIFFFPVNTINGITDSVFTAFREAHWVFASNITQSVTKLLVLILLPALGAWGVIGSNVASVVVAVILCLVLIAVRYQVRFKAQIDRDIILKVRKFTLGNHLSGLIGGLPAMVLPMIITNNISPEHTAYYYMPNMIGMLLTMIPSTLARSYFTESSHAEKILSYKKPFLMSYAILVPVTIFFVFFGKIILNIFGKNYANEGYTFLVFTCISILVSVVNYYFGTRLLLLHDIKKMIMMNTLGTIVEIGAVYLLISWGVAGIGMALLATHVSVAGIYLLLWKIDKK
jgi:O-antigen/teichoic acid export membrane protein